VMPPEVSMEEVEGLRGKLPCGLHARYHR
jgi:hypothetical protein